MAKQVTYSIGPVVGCGRTKTEARENAERAAADWLQRMHDDGPILLCYGGQTRVIVPMEDGTAVYSGNGSSSYCADTDTARVVRKEALHLAQLAWDGVSTDPPRELAWRFGNEQRSDWYSWVAWQRSYKAWRAYGLSDQDTRHYIDGWEHLISEDGRRMIEAAKQAESVA